MQAFAALLDRPPVEPMTVGYQKLLPPLMQVVTNREEVLDHFSGSQFEAFVAASLGRTVSIR